jgi:hypothetical protein
MDLSELFESMTVEKIEGYVEERRHEDPHLDFKSVGDPTIGSSERKNLATALSGFANADGGIVVWGVEARKGVAEGTKPIDSVSDFVARLQEFTGVAVNPVVDGVVHKPLETAERKGYAVTLVPPSDGGPHMAKMGEDRYYKRSGDSFRRMEHFDVADMFGRRAKPKLEFVARPTLGPRSGNDIVFYLVISVRNAGRAAARAPYLALQVAPPHEWTSYGLDGNCHHGLARLPSTRGTQWIKFCGGGDVFVHPGVTYDITCIKRSFHPDDSRAPADVVGRYQIAADGLPVTEDGFVVSGSSIRSALLDD